METSLSEQLNDNAHGKVLKLELEIQHLQSALDCFRESSFHGSSEKVNKQLFILKLCYHF